MFHVEAKNRAWGFVHFGVFVDPVTGRIARYKAKDADEVAVATDKAFMTVFNGQGTVWPVPADLAKLKALFLDGQVEAGTAKDRHMFDAGTTTTYFLPNKLRRRAIIVGQYGDTEVQAKDRRHGQLQQILENILQDHRPDIRPLGRDGHAGPSRPKWKCGTIEIARRQREKRERDGFEVLDGWLVVGDQDRVAKLCKKTLERLAEEEEEGPTWRSLAKLVAESSCLEVKAKGNEEAYAWLVAELSKRGLPARLLDSGGDSFLLQVGHLVTATTKEEAEAAFVSAANSADNLETALGMIEQDWKGFDGIVVDFVNKQAKKEKAGLFLASRQDKYGQVQKMCVF